MVAQVVIQQYKSRRRELFWSTIMEIRNGRLHATGLVKRERSIREKNCFSDEKSVIYAVVNIQQRQSSIGPNRLHNKFPMRKTWTQQPKR
jgi:hypothetical protein